MVRLQQRHPFVPAAQAAAEAVQHDDGGRIARAGIAQMEPDARDLDDGGGRGGGSAGVSVAPRNVD